MPPKPKYTAEEIVDAALEVIREKGIDALTARELGYRLGTSARPIFTAFKSMEEVKQAAKKAAAQRFAKFSEDFDDYSPAFKKMGMLFVSFAIKEPMLYRFLLMQEHEEDISFDELRIELGDIVSVCVEVIQRDYGLSYHHARLLFDHLWVYSFGMGALCAMKVCTFSEEEIIEMLGHDFMGMMMLIKSGKIDSCKMRPIIAAERDKNEKIVSDM